MKNVLTRRLILCIINFVLVLKHYIGSDVVRNEEKYSRGRRGAPAKGVGRVTGARVQIPPSPFLLPK